MTTIYDIDALEEIRRRNAVQPHRMKLFRNALFKRSADWDEALETLPESARTDFKRNLDFQCLEMAERHDSEIDGASKLIFKTHDQHWIESVVLRPKTGRTSICISSQIGCVCNCSFCATGKMGFARNLTVGEILDQVTQANRMLKPEGRTIRNVVFMGMGEPLLNMEHVFHALELLKDPQVYDLAGSRITVSTVGIPLAMERFTAEYPDVHLALSLHSADQKVRQQIMPQARKYSLEQIREVLVKASAHGRVMIEYLMLAEVNDRDEDFQALEKYLKGIPVHINLIPFNEFAGSRLRGTSLEARKVFGDRLKAAGFQTTLRYSMGADIEAACGQLVRHKR
jgi:23S rRNA (adenine2503-C2)-methyltransferase